MRGREQVRRPQDEERRGCVAEFKRRHREEEPSEPATQDGPDPDPQGRPLMLLEPRGGLDRDEHGCRRE